MITLTVDGPRDTKTDELFFESSGFIFVFKNNDRRAEIQESLRSPENSSDRYIVAILVKQTTRINYMEGEKFKNAWEKQDKALKIAHPLYSNLVAKPRANP